MTDSVSKTDERDPTDSTPEEEGGVETAARGADPATDRVAASDDSPGSESPIEDGSGDDLDEEILSLRQDFKALNDRHLRLAAEFNNYRRRNEAERLDLWSRAQAEVVGRFLDILDDVQRVAGLDLTNATVDAIMEGIDLVDRKFVRVLSDMGVEIVDPVGERFDPATMEAVMRAPAESEEEDDQVAQVFQKGYALKGVLIRPARVSVSKHG